MTTEPFLSEADRKLIAEAHPQLNNQELEVAFAFCERHRLLPEPLAAQVHLMLRKSKVDNRWVEKLKIQVGIDGFRAIADRTQRYMGHSKPEWFEDRDGRPVKVELTVYKAMGSQRAEFPTEAWYDEYVQTSKNGSPNRMWKTMPRMMLTKCCEALALRQAFPDQLSGIYAPEELGSSEEEIAGEVPARRDEREEHVEPASTPASAPAPASPPTQVPAGPEALKNLGSEIRRVAGSLSLNPERVAEVCNDLLPRRGGVYRGGRLASDLTRRELAQLRERLEAWTWEQSSQEAEQRAETEAGNWERAQEQARTEKAQQSLDARRNDQDAPGAPEPESPPSWAPSEEEIPF